VKRENDEVCPCHVDSWSNVDPTSDVYSTSDDRRTFVGSSVKDNRLRGVDTGGIKGFIPPPKKKF